MVFSRVFFKVVYPEWRLLSFAKVMEHYPFYWHPPHPPLSPTTGERIKVRGSNVMEIFVPLFT